MAEVNNRNQMIGMVAQIMEEEEADFEELMMAVARIAAAEIMEDEEGPGYGELLGPAWAPVTVVIDDYHLNPCFHLHFRMSRPMFLELSGVIRDHLDATGRRRRERTDFLDIMLMVVWLLATPDSFRSVALRFGVTPGTLHYFYRYIIEALRELSVRYIVWPSREEREVIKHAWEEATGFPGVIGAIDCTHVPISAPLETPANYVNRHDLHSINVQCVVDNNLLVREIHAGEVGSMNDRRVFRRSALHRRMLERGDDRIIEDDENLVGDGGYTLTDFMMIPFPNNGHLTPEQQTYNRALSQARVRVENAFGLGKGKWRRLKYLYVRDPALAVDHITACFVIHNFLIMNGAAMIDDEQLRRPVRPHEILGNENFDNNPDDPQDIVNPNLDDAEEVAALLRAAEDRGAEKRNMIMHRLHNQHA